MIELSNYITEYYSSDLLKDEKDWMKVSSSEYGIYIEDQPTLYEMIPYKEYGLKKPDSILLTIKREGPRWIIIVKWTCDKKIYVCNGWKTGDYDIKDLANTGYEIISHLSKSKKARSKFKDQMMTYYNVIKNHGLDPIGLIDHYDSQIIAMDLEELLEL